MTLSTKTHSEAVEALLKAVETDLTDSDYPAVSQLRSIALQLDKDSSVSSLHGQFGLTYRDLIKRIEARRAPVTADPLEALLSS